MAVGRDAGARAVPLAPGGGAAPPRFRLHFAGQRPGAAGAGADHRRLRRRSPPVGGQLLAAGG
ncbi:hypothetical protein SDC9_186276 [bioreactor metagenome]|uniref:Uncharacterized protein n=1 Tax=bioreactor metagenome TaxID=1076179 RepID=A0A645HIA1_9ZZZZ